MDQIIDLIFENPFFLIIIIGALFSLFSGKKKEEQKEQQRSSQQNRPRPESVNAASRTSRRKQQVNRGEQERERVTPQLSIEEQRAKQLAQFASKNVSSQHHSDSDVKTADGENKRKTEIQELASSYSQREFKREFKKSLSRKGLINSVIMSEVLGPPRARNPYKSVISKRKNRK